MSVYENYEPIDLEKINTYELASRPSKVTVEDFARPVDGEASLKEFLETLRELCRDGRLETLLLR